MRILVVVRSYPAPGDFYQYPFVHRRVLAYRRAGHEVAVFRPTEQAGLSTHEFEDVRCHSGNAAVLQDFALSWRPDVIAAHGFAEQMWTVLEPLAGTVPVRAWLHGSEIPAFFRAKATCIREPAERSRALLAVQERCRFWSAFLERAPKHFGLVFVSDSAVDMAREDWGDRIDHVPFAVIPNPIDTELFAYAPKAADDRWDVLTIRPFDSPTYGNDMTVAVIEQLARETQGRARFTMIGDGPLFDETTAPLHSLEGVRVERRFLAQSEIAAEHRRHGIFLVPTRLDTQGVSRDEAMSSGLVPVTNAIPAVNEFVDESCAALAAPDDVQGLVVGLRTMLDDPQLFLDRSAAAAGRVRRQTAQERVIPAELQLLRDAACA
ncbi:glycosyltransferase involved in cell wall biosynthesis [Sphingomonas sp. F9_3S_D5_B_2]